MKVSFEIERNGDLAFAVLSHRGRGLRQGGTARQRYTVRIEGTEQHLGGLRWWWRCPYQGRRAAHLFLPLGALRFGSRQAWRLAYSTQRMSPAARARTRLTRGCRKLGGITDLLGPLPSKPPWMRWATYDRLVARLEPIAEQVDRDAGRSFALGFERIMRMSGTA